MTGLSGTYKELDGTVNVEEDVTSGDGSLQVTNFSTAAPSSAGALQESNAVEGVRPVTQNFTVAGAAACRPGPGCVVCHQYSLATTYTDRKEIFDNLYSYFDAPATVTESTGSSHSLGVGTAVTNGAWSASGTAAIEWHSKDSSVVGHDHHLQLSNAVDYGHYTRLCTDGYTHHYYGHEVRPTGFYALQAEEFTKTINTSLYIGYPSCSVYTHGTFTKSSGHNITFSAGVAAPYLSLSSNASYSSDTEVAFKIEGVTDLCGSDGTGWASSTTFGAMPPPPCGTVLPDSRRVSPLC